MRWPTGTARKPARSPTAGPRPRSCCGTWPRYTTQTPARRRPGPNDSARATEVKCSGRRDRPPRGTAKQMLMAVAQSAMHDWLDHPFAVSRPRPSPAGVPRRRRVTALRSPREVHGGYISGRRQVDGGCYAWYVSRRPGPRQEFGWVVRAQVYSVEVSLASKGSACGFGGSPALSAACTWLSVGSATREPGARTYADSAPCATVFTSFAQVRCDMEVQGGAVCKTVGSAYVGSNPTPATTWENGLLAAETQPGGPFPSCRAVYQGATLRIDAWQYPRTYGVQRPGKTAVRISARFRDLTAGQARRRACLYRESCHSR